MNRVLVCGGRDFGNSPEERWFIRRTLVTQHRERPFDLLIEGGATGADAIAYRWARELGIATVRFAADWTLHGKAAGPIRNRMMLREGRPTLVIGFPGHRGTADMLTLARAAGVEVVTHAFERETA